MLQKIALTVLFLAAVTSSPAQYRSSHPDDTNGDGAISRSEWRGDSRTFREYDGNRDGVLSGNEVPGSRQIEIN